MNELLSKQVIIMLPTQTMSVKSLAGRKQYFMISSDKLKN